jgi:hypothetical protein
MMELGASPLGVSCHEFGHYLGLPDMYNTTSGDSVVGDWCLMDQGCWLNNGFTPNYPCAWCKNYLGILSPEVISSGQQVSGLATVESSSSSVCQFNVTGGGNEYFLAGFTNKTANPYNPGTGVLIWHVDEGTIHGENFEQRIANNDINCYIPLTASLVTANGVKISGAYSGGRGDPWPGSKMAFAAPDSNSYSGYPSGITLYSFQLSATSASFYVEIGTSPFQGAVENNLGGAHPFPSFVKLSQGDKIKFMGITPNAELKIFTVAGNLVQTLKADSNGIVSPWDGSVEGGGKTGSGTYLIRVSDGMGNKKTLKVLILR